MPLAAQWLNYPTPGIPRTPNGKQNLSAPAPKLPDGTPDLSGLWQADDNPYVRDLQKSPLTPQGEAIAKRSDRRASLCLPPGIADLQASPFKIHHSSTATVVILYEYNYFRQIFLDGRRLPKDPNPTWLGYSIGKWDGDTLIVDIGGFNDQVEIIGGRLGGGRLGPLPHNEALRITERYHRQDFGHMEIQFSIEDPKVYTRPWSFKEGMHLLPDTELLEYICEENEKDFQHRVGPQ
jgi:hypothetical protein